MDVSYLPEIVSLAIFIVGFRPLVRKVGSHADLWFLGWSFFLLHDLALAVGGGQSVGHTPERLVAVWTLDLCAVTFMAVTANVPKPRLTQSLIVKIAAAVLALSALCAVPTGPAALRGIACALFLLPALHLLTNPCERSSPLTVLSVWFAIFGAGMVPLALRAPGMVPGNVLALLFLSAAYFYVTSAHRLTRGGAAAVAGLVLWGVSFPIVSLLTRYNPLVHVSRGVLGLPQVLIVAGILLTLVEEYVTSTERRATHDPLTDLPNRRLFEERLVATMAEAQEQGTTVACLVIDVDNFKTINDTLGHEAGDQLLRALAVRLSWHMSPRDILARTGGDEFTALLAGVRDEHHLRFIASAMVSAGSVPIAIDGHSVDVKISVGIALCPDHAEDIDALRRAADEAMYTAKRRGGSALAFAGEEESASSASGRPPETVLRSRASSVRV